MKKIISLLLIGSLSLFIHSMENKIITPKEASTAVSVSENIFKKRKIAGDFLLEAISETYTARYATLDKQGKIQIWDAETGALLKTSTGYQNQKIDEIKFSADGKTLIIENPDYTLNFAL